MRLALGIRYNGRAYDGWQSQPSSNTVQDQLEIALAKFAARSIRTLCAGRTDAGVHALMQVVHFDSEVDRLPVSWVRGTNRFLPSDIAVQWAQVVPAAFHCRSSAISRRYLYVLSQSPVRPSLDAGLVGWSMRNLDGDAMREAASLLVGTHDFSSFRAAACQARSPIKSLRRVDIRRVGAGERCRWLFHFEADAFLHHMIRNIMGCLLRVGRGDATPGWIGDVLQARSRLVAAPTFAPDGLYFVGPRYAPDWGLPDEAATPWDDAAYHAAP